MSTPEQEQSSQTLAAPPSVPPPEPSLTLETPPEPSQTLETPLSVPPSQQTAYQPLAAPAVHPTAAHPGGSTTDRHVPDAATGDGGTMAQAAPSAAALFSGPVVIRVPGYDILGELGRGGMGVVYKARQLGLKRLVAIKMILSGDYAAAGDLARFRLEAEAVAKLQHPGIVQVYAIDEVDGKPYFCLEFVNGGSLQKKLSGNPQPPRQAAQLVEKLAEAMAYAHHHHIVHRDLKPANVLLTETGDPKVADFGLAKRLDEQQESQTQSGSILGTPSYMAPEQAHGRTRDVGTAGDIYSLGAILYEALVGRPPFKGETVLDTLEMVRSQEPVAPSRLQPKIPRDLETICLKCLQKDPNHRYHSADALAEDLRRFQAREPILARPTPAWERAWKWARRRPLAAALIAVSALFALSLAAGGVAFGKYEQAQLAEKGRLMDNETRAREHADQNFKSARDAVDEMLTSVGQQRLAYEPRMEKVRRDLLTKALHFQERFLKEKSDDPEVRDEVGRAQARVGDIQEMLGDHEEAEQSYGAARTFLAELNAEFPSNVHYCQDLATCMNNLGQLLKNAGRTPEAEQALREALDLRQKLANEQGDEEDQRELANIDDNLGGLLLVEGRYAEAETLLRQSLGLLEEMAKTSSEPTYQQNLARGHNNLGLLLAAVGRLEDAEHAFREALAILQGLAKTHPDAPEYRQELAVSYNHLGNLWRDTKPAKAEEFYQQSLDLRDRLVADFPTTPVYRQEQAASYHSLGFVRQAAGRLEEAEKAYRQALKIEEKLVADFPFVPDFSFELAGTYNNLGILLQSAHHLPEAEKIYGKALTLLEKLSDDHPESPAYKQELANAQQNLGVLYQTTNRTEQAEKALKAAVELRRQLVENFPKAPIYQKVLASGQFTLATLWHMNGNLPAAEASYRKSVDGFTKLADKLPAVPDYRHLLADGLKNLGSLLQATKRPEEAEKDLREAADLLSHLSDEQPTVPVYRLEQARVLNDLGIFLASNGNDRGSDAEKAWGQALALQEQLIAQFPDNPVYKQEAANYHGNMGVLFTQEGRLAQAEQSYRQAVAQLEQLEKASPDVAVYWQNLVGPYNNLINLLRLTGASSDEVEKDWRRLVELRRKLADAYPKTAELQSDLGVSLAGFAGQLRAAKPVEARPLLEDAVARQRSALELSPDNGVYRQRLAAQSLLLAQTLADLKDYVRTAAVVGELVKSAPSTWSDQHLAAACLAKCAGLADKDEKLSAAERMKLVESYADQSVALLRQAMAHGFKGVDYVQTTADFESLRSRDDFKKLLADLQK
jgi:eukaryotic-like serine/threonine-protein kinase